MSYRSTRERTLKMYIGAFLMVATGFGSILAANIVINSSNNGQEFGQGTYQIKACDTWVQLNLIEGSTGSNGASEGLSPLTGISVSGLDPKQCRNTQFTISGFSKSNIPDPIYRTDGAENLCSEAECSLGSSAENSIALRISESANVSLLKPDSPATLSYDPKTGIYRILFTHPAILASNLDILTIQSQDWKA